MMKTSSNSFNQAFSCLQTGVTLRRVIASNAENPVPRVFLNLGKVALDQVVPATGSEMTVEKYSSAQPNRFWRVKVVAEP